MSHINTRNWIGAVLLAAALVGSAAREAAASSITIGNPASGEINTFPFGGAYAALLATRYQQVYSGSLFGGSFSIDAVSFYAADAPGLSGTNANGTYTLSLSTTSAGVNGLSSNLASNVGTDTEAFFSGALPPYPPAAGDLLTFTLATPFTFDPANGNLLLDVQFSGVTNGSNAFYVAQNGDFGSASSRMVNGGRAGTSFGLVTTFDGQSEPTVPEPTTMLLVGTGLIASIKRTGRSRTR